MTPLEMHAELQRRLLAAQELPRVVKDAVDQRLSTVHPPGVAFAVITSPTGVTVHAESVPVTRLTSALDARRASRARAVAPKTAIARLRGAIEQTAMATIRKILT